MVEGGGQMVGALGSRLSGLNTVQALVGVIMFVFLGNTLSHSSFLCLWIAFFTVEAVTLQ